MVPDDKRLLTGLRQAISEIVRLQQDTQCLSLLNCMDVVIDELLKRQDFSFHDSYYRRGRALFAEVAHRAGKTALQAAQALETIQDEYSALPDHLEPLWNTTKVAETEQGITDCLARLVDVLDQFRIDPGNRYLSRVVEWEAGLHAFRASPASMPPFQSRPPDTIDKQALESYLQEKLPDEGIIGLKDCHIIPGGFSKTTIDVETESGKKGPRNYVLRMEQPVRMMHIDGSHLVNEFPVVRLAFESGIPVAAPLWLETDSRLFGAPFMVSLKAPGRTMGSAVGASNTQVSIEILTELTAVLARIHNIPIDHSDSRILNSHLGKWTQYKTLTELYPAYVDYWHRQAELSGIVDTPAISRAFTWLKRYPPSCGQAPALLHGDYGLHNILIHEGRISAVLDWEGAQLGDPADEFFILTNALKPVASAEKILRLYQDAGGRELSEYRLRYSEVLFSMKALIIGYAALKAFDMNQDASFKMCYVGLRHMFPGLLNESILRAESARN